MLALEEKYDKDVEFIIADVNTPEGNELAGEYGVRSIPAIFILDGKGKVVKSELGYQPQNKLEGYIDEVIKGK